jgi:hypothetical protein
MCRNNIDRMWRIFILLLVSITVGSGLNAQKGIRHDSSDIHARELSKQHIDVYKNTREFQYDKEVEPAKSLWTKFWEWFWRKVGDLLGTTTGGRIFNMVIISVAIAVLIFFIVKVTGMSGTGLFGKKNTGDKFPYSELDENIHTIHFDEAIQRAIEDKNLRLAVRLLYLQALKNLSDKGNISWQPNKTNYTYVQELGGTPYQSRFTDLTRQFENNWYGNFFIPENEFTTLRQSFIDFNRQL